MSSEQEFHDSRSTADEHQAEGASIAVSENLFYAYARRTDHAAYSRYMLTFENADVAQEWWELIQQEYPEKGVRNGAQLFSFVGDNFLYYPTTNKKFEHLKNKWLYTQFADATGTSGRQQEVIPLQDAKGYPLGSRQPVEHPKVVSKPEELPGAGHLDLGGLSAHLQQIQATIEYNASQVQTLTEGQRSNNEREERMGHLIERIASHVQALAEKQSTSLGRMESIMEQNASQIKTFVDKQATTLRRMQSTLRQTVDQMVTITEKQAGNIDRMQSGFDQNVSQLSSLTKGQETNLGRMETVMNRNASQIRQLVDGKATAQERITSGLEQNALQIKALSNGQTASQHQLQSTLNQIASQIKILAEGQAASHQRIQSFLDQNASQTKTLANGQKDLMAACHDLLTGVKQQQEQSMQQERRRVASIGSSDYNYYTQPLPMKLDKKVMGSDSGYDITRASAASPRKKPPKLAPKPALLPKGATQS